MKITLFNLSLLTVFLVILWVATFGSIISWVFGFGTVISGCFTYLIYRANTTNE